MKTLIALLFILTIPAFGQTSVSSSPAISTTEIDSIITDSTSTTVRSVTKPFSGITAGMRVVGLRIPFMTTVVSNTNDSILVLSNKPTATVALDSMRFAKFTQLQYSAGDALGFPFEVPLHAVKNVIVEDDSKQATSIKLLFFRDRFTETEDNLPFAISDADAKKVIGYMLVDSNNVYANNHIMYKPQTTLPIYFGNSVHIYCQLIAVGTPTFTAVDNLRVTLIGD